MPTPSQFRRHLLRPLKAKIEIDNRQDDNIVPARGRSRG
jgi:hypothetical protein